jgi:hypothetical protein
MFILIFLCNCQWLSVGSSSVSMFNPSWASQHGFNSFKEKLPPRSLLNSYL